MIVLTTYLQTTNQNNRFVWTNWNNSPQFTSTMQPRKLRYTNALKRTISFVYLQIESTMIAFTTFLLNISFDSGSKGNRYTRLYIFQSKENRESSFMSAAYNLSAFQSPFKLGGMGSCWAKGISSGTETDGIYSAWTFSFRFGARCETRSLSVHFRIIRNLWWPFWTLNKDINI